MARAVVAGVLCGALLFPFGTIFADDEQPGSEPDRVLEDKIEPTPEQRPVAVEPTIVVEPVDPDEVFAVWRSARFNVTVINGSFAVGVDSITVSIPNGVALEVAGAARRAGAYELVTSKFQLSQPGQRRTLQVELTPIALREMGSLLPRVLSYRRRKEFFGFTLAYKPIESIALSAKKATRTKIINLPVTVQPRPIGMYAGALLGLVLGAIFVGIMDAGRSKDSKSAGVAGGGDGGGTRSPATLADLRRQLLFRVARGGVATAIVVLLFQSTSDLSLPITLGVHDFYGGVVLGLFADKVARVIYERVTSPD